MFSPIVALMQKIEQIKLNKQKQELKKTVKKEEQRLETEDNKTLIESKGNAKSSEETKKSKIKELKLKVKVMVLRLLKYILQLIESFILFLISVFGTLGFFIILVVLVLMIAIYGLLHIDFNIPSDDVLSTKSDCIQGSSALGNYNFDEQILNQLGSTLTEQQKNIYRSLKVYQELFDGTFGKTMWSEEFPDILSSVGITNISSYLIGFVSTENGMNFNNGNKNILENTAYFTHNNQGYGGFGLPTNATLDAYAPEIAAKVKEKYPKPSDYTGYDTDFVPYAIAIQTYEMSNSVTNYSYFKLAYDFVKNNNSEIEDIFNKYGVVANRDKLKTYLVFMGTSCYYHGGGMNLSQVSLWTAIWSSTSSQDSDRSFEKIEILSDSYGESLARTKILGTGGVNNCTAKWGQAVTPYFKVNGEEVVVTFWSWVRENCSNKDYFDSTAKAWLDSKADYAGSGVILNGHYGFLAYMMGQKILKDLGVSMPVSSGGNPEDCDCYEGSSGGSLDVIDISAITVGEAQGPWSSELLEKINNRMSNTATGGGGLFKNHFGKNFIGSADFTKAEEWRVKSKWKVPYYYQADSAGISFRSNGLRYNSAYGSLNACGTYMLSYLMSASSGKMINPIETFAVGLELGIFQSDGLMVYSQSNFDKLKEYGINIANLAGSNSTANKEKVDACLEKGGLVGLYSLDRSNIFVSSMHFFVITEKIGDKYNVYSATGFNRDTTKSYTWNEVTKGAVRFFLVSDINRGSSVNNFTNYLFLGDSFTVGLEQNIKLTEKGHQVKAVTGKSPSYWLSDTQFNTLPSSVNGVVVLLGVNNTSETSQMQELLIKLKEKYNKPIYVQKVFPVGSAYANAVEMNKKIDVFNETIKSFCSNTENITFVDTTTGLVGPDGYLANADGLGLHLSSTESYVNWWSNIESTIGSANQKTTNTNCNESNISGPAEGMTNAKELKEERWKRVLGNFYNTYFEDNWNTGSSRGVSSKWTSYCSLVQSVETTEIEKITVQAWDYDSNKNWESYSFDLLVHKNIANSVKAIFDDLFALPENERTPIHNNVYEYTMAGITYKHNGAAFALGLRGGSSIHNIGAAIDINPDENPMPGQYGDIRNYKPGVDPYSISDTSKLVEIFGKYGFERGRTYKDYMHFSYFEDVTKNNNTYGK